MKKTLKTLIICLSMLITGAIIASLTYWIASVVFKYQISKCGLIVNVITDAIIFCSFPLVYLHIKKIKSKQK